MQRISTSTAVALRPSASSGGTPGFFTDGNAASGLPGTVVDDDFLNGIQETLANPIEASGQTLNAADDTQLAVAIALLGNAPVWSSAFAKQIKGYPNRFLVQDASSPGEFWLSTAANNLTTPGASGASWVTLSSTVGGRWIGTKRFTVSGTYTPTPGTLFAHVRIVGGGASGYGCKGQSSNSTVSTGAGGNAGTYADVIILNPTACSVVIAGSTANGYNGTSITGGTSSFGSYVTCPGGGAASGADQVTPIWATGNHSYARPSIASGVIANYLLGDAVGGQGMAFALTAGFGGQGANSPFGVGGGQSQPGATGDDGQGCGSGGAGTMSAQNGGALQSGRGAPGYAIVAEWGAI